MISPRARPAARGATCARFPRPDRDRPSRRDSTSRRADSSTRFSLRGPDAARIIRHSRSRAEDFTTARRRNTMTRWTAIAVLAALLAANQPAPAVAQISDAVGVVTTIDG